MKLGTNIQHVSGVLLKRCTSSEVKKSCVHICECCNEGGIHFDLVASRLTLFSFLCVDFFCPQHEPRDRLCAVCGAREHYTRSSATRTAQRVRRVQLVYFDISRKITPLRRSRSFKVTDFGTNRKLIYDFLLVINTNLPPILHRVIKLFWYQSKAHMRLPISD